MFNCWFSIKNKLSFENVENVVNPPQKPVTMSRLWLLDRLVFPTNSPITKQPIIFARNVAIGNDMEGEEGILRLMR